MDEGFILSPVLMNVAQTFSFLVVDVNIQFQFAFCPFAL